MNYVADSLYTQAKGQMLTMRYKDVIVKRPVDPRSGEEIVNDVMKRGGLRFGE